MINRSQSTKEAIEPLHLILHSLEKSFLDTGLGPGEGGVGGSLDRLKRILALPKGVKTPGTIHGIGLPIHIYPLYENAFRAHRHQTPPENNRESARLYAQFAKIAAGNEYAWNRKLAAGLDEEKIGRVGKGNRMICWPCEFNLFCFEELGVGGGKMMGGEFEKYKRMRNEIK
ncbi:hypothetical protein NHQ30_009189 [Ciborinia camelliae]|nr:hypothetical protein NHQ30_009189 [Ciborinia camelliae]